VYVYLIYLRTYVCMYIFMHNCRRMYVCTYVCVCVLNSQGQFSCELFHPVADVLTGAPEACLGLPLPQPSQHELKLLILCNASQVQEKLYRPLREGSVETVSLGRRQVNGRGGEGKGG